MARKHPQKPFDVSSIQDDNRGDLRAGVAQGTADLVAAAVIAEAELVHLTAGCETAQSRPGPAKPVVTAESLRRGLNMFN